MSEEYGIDIEVEIVASEDDGTWSQVDGAGDGASFTDTQVKVGYEI